MLRDEALVSEVLLAFVRVVSGIADQRRAVAPLISSTIACTCAYRPASWSVMVVMLLPHCHAITVRSELGVSERVCDGNPAATRDVIKRVHAPCASGIVWVVC